MSTDSVPFYLDRNLGRATIATALRQAGFSVEIHDDHLPQNAPDEDWIQLVGERRWIAITKDKNIRYRASEISAIKQHCASVLVLRTKNMTGQDMADLLIRHAGKVQRYMANHAPPVIVGITREGKLIQYYP